VEQSRDRFLRELSKFEAEFEQRKFFTEEGVKDRKESIKLKVLMNSTYSNNNPARKASDTSDRSAKEGKGGISDEEKFLRILQVHNMKVEKIIGGFHERVSKKK
jgi:hypothetical protein